MLLEELVAEATSRGLTIACAESVTGGLLVAKLIDVPGSSAAVAGGVVAYTVAVKQSVLGVLAEVIEANGVVSEAVALAMAFRVRELFSADVGVGTTGAAGPEGHGGRPAGTICVGSVGPAGEFSATAVRGGDRRAVREAAVGDALAVLALALGITAS